MNIMDANGAIACAECAKNARNERDQLQAENAKLRELVEDMHMCLTWQNEPHGYMEDGCDSCRFRGKTNGMCGLGMFRGRARDLGVEVDE